MAYLSIIIPCFNREDLLPQTLQCLEQQTFRDFECILIDDNSTDATQDVIKILAARDPRFRLVVKPLQMPAGPAASKNLGLNYATGVYVHFFDSDDILEQDFYAKCFTELSCNQWDAFLVRLRWFDYPQIREFGYSPPINKNTLISGALLRKHEIWTQNVLWKKSLLDKSPKHDETLIMSEDIVFAVGALTGAQAVGINNDLFVDIRRHTNSLTFSTASASFIRRARSVFSAYMQLLKLLRNANQETPATLNCCHEKMRRAILHLFGAGIINGQVFTMTGRLIKQQIKDKQWLHLGILVSGIPLKIAKAQLKRLQPLMR
jgi:glycosyltransferase involved in cell wall biosynthesis